MIDISITDAIEEWRTIDGAKQYQVSNFGNVRGIFGKLLTPFLTHNGYHIVKIILDDGSRKNRRVHVIVAAAFNGQAPAGHEVNHKDGVKTNNEPSNLEYVTRHENMKHSYRLGLHKPNTANLFKNRKQSTPAIAL